ncbi:RNA polymerase sigma factor [Tundrisphaera sp. TA3]|uniref:RNA polymerase sigma factor n=1 Tax=Tundrisphaera sp. TA3 TaxID=3435775 RepID=UPI003EC0C8D0
MAEGSNLDQISTAWSDLMRAHTAAPDEATEARRKILERYDVAVFRYLCKASGNLDRARDLFQEFSLRFIQGDFRGADRERGRFRAYLKTSLSHLVSEMNRRNRPAFTMDPKSIPDAAIETPSDRDAEFADECRATILGRAWDALPDGTRGGEKPLRLALQLRANRPKEPSRALAAELSRLTGREVTPNGFDKMVCQARPRYADRVLALIAESLGDPSREAIEAELIELGLHGHCRDALRRFGRDRGPA